MSGNPVIQNQQTKQTRMIRKIDVDKGDKKLSSLITLGGGYIRSFWCSFGNWVCLSWCPWEGDKKTPIFKAQYWIIWLL